MMEMLLTRLPQEEKETCPCNNSYSNHTPSKQGNSALGMGG